MKPQETTDKAGTLPKWEKTQEQNLVRNTSSGILYARFRAGGKLQWKSLKTNVFTVAKQRLRDAIADAKTMKEKGDGKLTLEQAFEIHLNALDADRDTKVKTLAYHRDRIAALTKKKTWPTPMNTSVARITVEHCQDWAKAHADYSATNFNATRAILSRAFEIAIERGARTDNPMAKIRKAKVPPRKLKLILPSTEQFNAFVESIAGAGSGWSKQCAELVRFLAFGGFRIDEAIHITWADVDRARGEFTVRGGEHGLKARKPGEVRYVPIIADMDRLLDELREITPDAKPTDGVVRVHECKKAMDTAAAKLGIPRLTHHDLRHYFATRCIESGVDIPTVSRWLGHKDGGALAMRTYGHLRDEHSREMARRVSFGSKPEPDNVVTLGEVAA
jgi:integrase